METIEYQLEYIDAATGQPVRKTISHLHVAQSLAKQLAQASGRRAVITRVRRAPTQPLLWTVHLAHAQTREVVMLWEGLTKAEVLSRWKLWRERKTHCVLVAWPQWLPPATISIPATDPVATEPT